MKQNLKLFATLAASAAMMISCQQAEEPTMDKAQEPVVKTRAYGNKTPKVAMYVEINDVNPLNAGDYLLSDGTTYADIVEFFAANLNKETVNGVVRPTLYLNDKMTNLLENGGAATYVAACRPRVSKSCSPSCPTGRTSTSRVSTTRRPTSSLRFSPMPWRNTGSTESGSTMSTAAR